jgi:hypothetical protein
MEEDRLAPEDVLVVDWCPAATEELAPAPRDEEILSFTDFHRLGLGLPCILSRVASYTSTVFTSMT